MLKLWLEALRAFINNRRVEMVLLSSMKPAPLLGTNDLKESGFTSESMSDYHARAFMQIFLLRFYLRSPKYARETLLPRYAISTCLKKGILTYFLSKHINDVEAPYKMT